MSSARSRPPGPGGPCIVACASPWGRGAVSLLRLSGGDALTLAQRLSPGGPAWRPRRASLRRLVDEQGELLDTCLLTWMPGPRSFSGEDVVELACHGNPLIVELLLDACVRLGARPARAGEFTRRALENGRLGLIEAEALAEQIAARSPAGLRLSRQAGQQLAPALEALYDRLLDLAAELEARLDHPGEDLGLVEDEDLLLRLTQLRSEVGALAGSWRAGRVAISGLRLALVGPVNAGKSSLFNALLGRPRALVSATPGTTRDAVESSVRLDDLDLVLVDTAGERLSADPLEQAGIELGRALAEEVDLCLLVVDGHREAEPAEAELRARLFGKEHRVVLSHADLGLRPGRVGDLALSNLTGQGIDELKALLLAWAREGEGPAGARLAVINQRQHALLQELGSWMSLAQEALVGEAGVALAAEAVQRGLGCIGELTGRDVREEVLDRLFARFCIGK